MGRDERCYGAICQSCMRGGILYGVIPLGGPIGEKEMSHIFRETVHGVDKHSLLRCGNIPILMDTIWIRVRMTLGASSSRVVQEGIPLVGNPNVSPS